jgi:hypothetical protein
MLTLHEESEEASLWPIKQDLHARNRTRRARQQKQRDKALRRQEVKQLKAQSGAAMVLMIGHRWYSRSQPLPEQWELRRSKFALY